MEYRVLEQLSKYGLLTDFLKSKVLENKIKDINLSESEKAEARDHYIKFFSLKNELLIEEHRKKNLLSKENLLYRMNLNKKVQKYCEDKYDEFIGKEYLSNKGKLDMVKYSMIRVKEYGLAMELYLKIKDDNEDFNELAKKYSTGIEKKTNGVIGPLPLESVNNLIRPKFSKNNLNTINKPFKYNNEWIICRLDEYKESKLDKNTVMNLKSKILDEEIEREFVYEMPDELKAKFSKSDNITFDVKEEYKKVFAQGLKSKVVLERSIEQHAQICVENSEDVFDARILAKELKDEIAYRIKQYSYCIMNNTKNYKEWLEEDYERKLRSSISKKFAEMM